MKELRGFASDNCSGIHPKIMEAITRVNTGHELPYGNDIHTCSATAKFHEHLGPNVDVYFVGGGTAANVLGLEAVTRPHNSIICAETAHINVDECGAPEKFTGCKLETIPSKNGKITPEQCLPFLNEIGNQHHVQPEVISITQATERGTVYSADEICNLTEFAHDHKLFVHMDGARLANAAAHLGTSLRSITTDAGIDLLSFGGTKNGMLFGEAVVFFDKELSEQFRFIRKQGMQLFSKMRFISAQFEAMLSDNLFMEIAEHANRMAKFLADMLESIPSIEITGKVQSNVVFTIIPPHCVQELLKNYNFYVWNRELSEVRLMTTFDTTEEDVELFADTLRKVIEQPGK
ncbi:MAG: low specificity L-threonine aldolase [Candidatus Latescibacteria bacterium]|jgi:threonine aldolase|nr:low specificity L-threonine aldolase [Candidatus Latescibacterota bacterium]